MNERSISFRLGVSAAPAAVTVGHSYTLTLINHDDNATGDATNTLFDDITLN